MKLAALVVGARSWRSAVVWLAGEQHRENCIRSGKARCSVLLWESGAAAGSARLTPESCEQLKLRNEAASTVDDLEPLPRECR